MPTIDVNGTNLHYIKQGSGPPLLLIHGTGGDADAFAPVLSELAQSHAVVAYDRRGFSRSRAAPHPPHQYLSNHAADAAGLLRALGVATADVVGWSAGGLVALMMASEHPPVIKSLVLYEPPYLVKKHASAGFTIAFLQIMALRAIGAKRAAAQKFYRTVFARRDRTNDFDSSPRATREALLANASPLLAELDAGTGEDLPLAKLRALTQRVTLLTGAQSAPLFDAAAERVMKAVPVRRRMSAPNAGHAMQLTDPSGFTTSINALLQET